MKDVSKRELYFALNLVIFLSSLFCIAHWFTGKGFLYSENSPVLSPFTSLSLLGISGVRLAAARFVAWGKPMSLAILGVVACGNASNILMLTLVPGLLLQTMPFVVATSIFTSIGLILFCLYDVIVLIRPTPKSFFILDDILIHLALFPGGLSLVGYLLDSPNYLSLSADPRVGISPLEMGFMASIAISSLLENKNLFLWDFLGEGAMNWLIFFGLFLNQYVAPSLVGWIIHDGSPPQLLGLEFFVMLAGVMATLSFLSIQAFLFQQKATIS